MQQNQSDKSDFILDWKLLTLLLKIFDTFEILNYPKPQ